MNLKRDGSLNFVQNFWSVPMVFRCFTTNFWIGETVDPPQSKVYLGVISVIDWFSSYRCSKFCTKCIKVAKIHHRFLPVLNDYWHSLSCWVVYLDLGQKSDPGILGSSAAAIKYFRESPTNVAAAGVGGVNIKLPRK